MKPSKLLSLLWPLLFLVANPSQAHLSSDEIDQLAEKSLNEFTVPGISITFVNVGKIIHEKGYVVQSATKKLAVDENTNFQIASNSKAFTTAALAILIDEGKLKWSDKVRTYLPEFKMYNDYVTENFTVEDLLCHRSGLGLSLIHI